MKKVYASFLIFLFCLAVAPVVPSADGISSSGSWVNVNIQEKPVQESKFRTAVSEQPVLASNLKELEDELYQEMSNYVTDFSISYKGSTSHLKEELHLLIDGILNTNQYLGGTVHKWGYSFKGKENDVLIQFSFTYLTNKKQEEFVDQEIDRILETLIEKDMTKFEQVKAVNDYIVLQSSYSFDTKASPHSVYALLNEQKGVCQAYALLAYKMLNELGIETYYVTGYAGGEAHAWNLVEIEGEWYYLDTTWNDPIPNQKAQVHYTYFLVTGDQLKKDHQWNETAFPEAASLKYADMHDAVSAFTFENELFYSNESDGDTLYKLNLDSKEKVKLSDSRAFYVTVAGDWVYFSNYSNGARLTKVKKDGTEQQELNVVNSTNLYIEENSLYYVLEDDSIRSLEIEMPFVVDTEKYNLWNEQRTKDREKEWLIEFNSELDSSAVSEENVYIVDYLGNKVSMIKSVVENERFIRLQNSGSFEVNQLYYLIIEDGIVSTKGTQLSKGIYMPFKVDF